MNDMKNLDNTSYNTSNATQEENNMDTNRIKSILQKLSDSFHKFALYVIVSMAIGIYIGISVSKAFYTNKLAECVKIGGMLHNEKVYTVNPK